MIYLFDIAFNWSNYVKQMWNLSLGLIEDISLTTGGFKAVDNVSEKWITIKLLTVVVHWAVGWKIFTLRICNLYKLWCSTQTLKLY